jgi:hypothetical protein
VTIRDFSSLAASLGGKFVGVAARYQDNGTQVAVRIWTSSTFNTVWISPEGHVLHVNSSTDVMVVENENGIGIPITVDGNTQFFFRQPQDGLADATPIATGRGFLAAKNLVRGFKVHVGVVDSLAVPLVAQTVDIEIAKYDGFISAPNGTGFVRVCVICLAAYKIRLAERARRPVGHWRQAARPGNAASRDTTAPAIVVGASAPGSSESGC